MSKKKILLTGSSGFIGKNILFFLGKFFDIIEVSRSSNYDINNLNSLFKIDNIDTVIHAAAETFIPQSFIDPYRFYKFNLNGSLNIAEFCRIKKVSKLIYLNTFPYGTPKYNPIDENHSIFPHSPYTKSKMIAERIFFQYLEKEVNITSLRIFNPYGYFQKEDFLIPTIVKQALKSNTIEVRDIRPKRDYIYIEDLTLLLKNILNTSDSEGIYNVGTGNSYSISEIISIVEAILNKKFHIKTIAKPRENEVLDCYADIKKAKNKFNWSPTIDLLDGLKKYVSWVKNN